MAPLSTYPLAVLQWAIVLKNRHLPGPIHTTQLNHDHRGMCLSMTEVEWVLLTRLKPTSWGWIYFEQHIPRSSWSGTFWPFSSNCYVNINSVTTGQEKKPAGHPQAWENRKVGVRGGGRDAYFRWKRLSKDIHKILNYEWLNVMFT